MTNNQVHEAFNLLYTIARKLPVTGDEGDMRDNAARILQFSILQHYPEKPEPSDTGKKENDGDPNPNLKAVDNA